MKALSEGRLGNFVTAVGNVQLFALSAAATARPMPNFESKPRREGLGIERVSTATN